jgi:hypothetical protein
MNNACCTCGRATDARCCEACLPVVVDAIVEQATRDARVHDLAVAALGPWGRVRYWFGSWLASTSIAYWGAERYRWWQSGQRLRERAWLLIFPALAASERVYTLAERFGRPV